MWLIKQLKQQRGAYNFSKHKTSYSQPKFLVKLFACLLLAGNCICATADMNARENQITKVEDILEEEGFSEAITKFKNNITSGIFEIEGANYNLITVFLKVIASKLVGENAIAGAITAEDLNNLAIIAASITNDVAGIEDDSLKKTNFDNITAAIKTLATEDFIKKIPEGEKSTYLNNLLDAARLTPLANNKIVIKALSSNYSGDSYCYFAYGASTLHSTKVQGVIKGKTYEKTDLAKGNITIDPQTMDISGSSSGIEVVYAEEGAPSLQKVTDKPVYEYISGHKGTGAIGKDSTIYFGLTPATAGNNYYLAAFNYKSPGEHLSDAITLDLDELKPKLTEGTLKSIVICSNLITKVYYGSGLYIFGDVTLAEGLIIAKAGSIQATDKKLGYGLDLRSVSLKADIINYGTIYVSSEGGIAVRVASSDSELDTEAKKQFGLLPPPTTTDKTARFKNYGIIQKKNNNGEAFRIAGQKRDEVDTFELTNYAGAEISGNFELVKDSTIKFDVVNQSRITASKVNVTNYTAKALSQLALLIKSASSPIVTCSNNFSLEKDAKIVLDPDGMKENESKSLTIVEAGSINLHGQQVADILYTKFGNLYIEATSATLQASKQITANLSAKKAPSFPVGSLGYMPDMVKAVNADTYITRAKKLAVAINKAIKIEIAGISNDHLKKIMKKKKRILAEALDYNDSAEKVFDISLPDSSNSQLISNNKVANKLMEQVAARIASKSMVAVKTGASKAPAPTSTKMRGVTSGDIAENISIWTGFNYLQSKTKKNDKKQSSSKLKAMVFSFGADSQLAYHDITLGASYGFANSNNQVQGGSSKMSMKEREGMLGEEDIKTHAFTIYSAMSIQQLDAQLALSYGMSKHEPKGKDKYNSSIMGVNIAATYPVDLDAFDIDITGSVGMSIVNTNEHGNKHGTKTPKENNNLVHLGLIAVITDVVDLNSYLSLDYKLGLGAKYTISSDKKSKIAIAIAKGNDNKDITIDYKKRQVSPFDFNIDANFNLQIQKNTHLGLDLNLGMGKDSTDFGVATSIRYMF